MIGGRELIYRDELYQILCKDKDHGLYVMHIDGWEDSTYFNGYGNDFLKMMNKTTAVDAVEVKYGQFVDGQCTHCGWFGNCVETPYYNYCPNCGAYTRVNNTE